LTALAGEEVVYAPCVSQARFGAAITGWQAHAMTGASSFVIELGGWIEARGWRDLRAVTLCGVSRIAARAQQQRNAAADRMTISPTTGILAVASAEPKPISTRLPRHEYKNVQRRTTAT
jgi:hypothetical protein